MRLIFNAGATDPANSLVQDVGGSMPASQPVLVVGDNPLVQLYVADGAGDYDSDSGSAVVTPWLGIGTPAGEPDSPVALQTTWSQITDGWEARLNLATDELVSLLGSSKFVESYLELQLVDASNNRRTVGQVTVIVRGQVLDAASTVPAPVPSYYTDAQVDALIGCVHRSSVQGAKVEGVTETTVATVTVPALGVDSEIVFSAVFTRDAGQVTNTKLNIYHDGALISCLFIGGEPVTLIPQTPIFSNRNATNSQVGGATAAGVLITASVDTSVETELLFKLENGDAADDCRLESLTVRHISAP